MDVMDVDQATNNTATCSHWGVLHVPPQTLKRLPCSDHIFIFCYLTFSAVCQHLFA